MRRRTVLGGAGLRRIAVARALRRDGVEMIAMTTLAPRHLALLAPLACALALVATDASPSAAQASLDTSLQCIEEAGNRTMLLTSQHDRLCIGAPTPTGPVDCFIEAQGMFLTDEQAITLCRCSPDPAPIACYRQVRSSTMLTQDEILALCAPTLVRGLGPSCR